MYVCNYVYARRDEPSTVYVCRRTARRAGCVSTQDARRRRPETHEMHRRHRSVAELMPCTISDGRWTMQTEKQRCTSRLLVRKLLTEMKRNSNRCRLTLQRDRATLSTMLWAPQEQAVSADGVSPPAVRVKPAVPSSQSFPISAIVSLPPHGWLHGLYCKPFLLSMCAFLFFCRVFITFSVFGSAGQIQLATSCFWAHVNISCRISTQR